MKTVKKISVVIACYKDEESIISLYTRLKKTLEKITSQYEIIYVNDGSPDNSQQILRELTKKDKGVIVITHSRNFGSQNAFTSGMLESTGDAVVLMDGDLQDPPELIEEFVEKWLEGYDVVYGERVQREGSVAYGLAAKLFYIVFSKLAYVKVPRNAGDFSLMDRKIVTVINSMPETDRFIRGMRAWAGFKQIGVPYRRPERYSGKSTNNWFSNSRWLRKAIFSFSYEPLELITILAALCTLFSVFAILFYMIAYFIIPNAPKGFMTLLLAVLFLGSIQLLCLSIIGEYLGRIFEEVKKRPKFIVKEKINAEERKVKEGRHNE